MKSSGVNSFRSLKVPASSQPEPRISKSRQKNFETESSLGTENEKTSRMLEYIADQTVE